MKIKTITFTGADDYTSIRDLYGISKRYPFVEWGILFSKSQEAAQRFPGIKWIHSLVSADLEGINLSAHLCGSWLRDILLGNYNIPQKHSDVLRAFKRVQLNTHGEEHHIGRFADILKAMNKQFIFQIDKVNDHIYRKARTDGVQAYPFFDLSHGAGQLPEKWDRPLDEVYCGYAGGLGPHNLQDALEVIAMIVGDRTIWIDMETHVRTDGEFDLDKVQQCIKIAERWM
jgi:hypothetical protein